MKKLLNSLFFVFTLLQINAQALTNLASLTINQGALVSVEGAFVNEQNGSVQLNGELTIIGNVKNNSVTDCFLPSNGKVTLSGIGPQSISGTHAWSFPILNLKNGIKNLYQTAAIGTPNNLNQAVLLLNSSFLILNTNSIAIRNSQESAIGRTSGFIVNEPDTTGKYGKIQWTIGNSSQGSSYVFPFGMINTGHYTPLQINLLKNSQGAKGTLIASTYATPTSAYPNNRPLPEGVVHMNDSTGQDMSNKSVDRFWTIESALFDSLPLMQVTMNYRDMEWDTSNNSNNLILEDSLVAQQYENNSWNTKNFTLNTNANLFNVTAINSPYQVWRLTDVSVLPNRGISLVSNNDIDAKYDLELTNNSEIHPSIHELQNLDSRVYPNPSSGLITIKFKSESTQSRSVKLIDLSGKIVDQWTIPKNLLESTRALSGVVEGTYVLIILNSYELSKQKLVLSK